MGALYIQSSLAESKSCLLEMLKISNEKAKKPFPSSFIDSVRALYPQAAPAESIKHTEAYQLIRDELLKDLPSNIADDVKEIDRHIPPTDSSRISGHQITWAGRSYLGLKISVPKRYFGTPVEYIIRIHELHHLTEWLIMKDIPGYRTMKTHGLNPNILFLREAGAMTTEWKYIQTLPSHERQYWIEQIRNDSKLKKKDTIIRVLTNGNLDGQSYLEAEWKAKRYDRTNVNSIVIANYINFLPLTTGLALVSWHAWQKCKEAANWIGDFEYEEYRRSIRDFCKTLGFKAQSFSSK